MENLLTKENVRSATAQMITDMASQAQTVHALLAPCQIQLTPQGLGWRLPGVVAVKGESSAPYLVKSLARPWQEAVGASTPSPAGAEGKDACSEAGGQGSTRAAAGEVLGHKGRIIPSGIRLINGTFIRPAHPTRPTHPHGMGYLKTQHTAPQGSPPGSWTG